MPADIKAVEVWAKQFSNRAEVVATITKNLAINHDFIMAKVATFKADIKDKAYFTAGEDLANLLAAAVGTVQSEAPAMVTMPVTGPPKFIAGFLSEFV